MFNAKRFCHEQNIDYTDRGKHSRPGWVQVRCPFCTGNPGWHGGFNIEAGYYNCYRCGYHWMPLAVSKILKVHISEAFKAISKYSSKASPVFEKLPTLFHRPPTISLPPDTSYVSNLHRLYLRNVRGFDNYLKIIRNWGLQSTGNIGTYQHRILAPILFEHRLVSYQCRATHANQSPPYLACAEKDEVLHHKHLVYGFDYAVPKRQCVVVEGITDVWRLGAGAVATFGKKYTAQQVLMLANNFDKVFKLFDADANDENQLEWDLASAGCDVEMIHLYKGDPGQLKDYEAAGLMHELGF